MPFVLDRPPAASQMNSWANVSLTALVGLPLLASFLVPLLARGDRRRAGRLSVGAQWLDLAAAIAVLAIALRAPPTAVFTVHAGALVLTLDHLSAMMAALVAAISLVVHVYSRRYMIEEPGYVRFFALLDAITAVILWLVVAGDLLSLLAAWFLVGVFLYALLGHDTTRVASGRYAFRTWITYRLGDLPLLGAALLLWHGYGTTALADIFSRVAQGPQPQFSGIDVPVLAALLVAVAAFARSAQFPLHIWLPYTMDGPTPVSALMHAGIVNAGGFLFNRFAPLFPHAGMVLHLTMAVGVVTALLGSALMLTQNDIKKSLGYSTMGQMGFMVMECGLGAFSLAVYHLIAHGLFKATLFLGSGGVIGEARHDDGVPANDIYTFVVERRPRRAARLPWLAAVAITVLVPVVVLALSHQTVSPEVLQRQGPLVLLFFGWVTGAQVFFSTHKLDTASPWRTMGMVVLSFLIVVVGYTLIAHVFDDFLLPDRALAEAIYASASIDAVAFDSIAVVVTVVLVATWLVNFYAQEARVQGRRSGSWHRSYLRIYGLVSREFYIAAFWTWCADRMLAASQRMNVWLRWL
jgi:NADH-quinone oxidoreductase subunit L